MGPPHAYIAAKRDAGDLTSMRRPASALFAAFAVVALALAPALSEARPGGGASSGSRGSRTYTAPPSTQTAPGTVRQFDRTETAPARPGQPGTFGAPAQPRPAAGGGFLGRNPLMAGIMGGLLGAGLFGLLTGAGLFGGLSGLAGLFGLLLQVALIAGIVWLVLRLVRGRRPAMAGGPNGYARDTGGNTGASPLRPVGGAVAGAAAASGAPAAARPVQISEADFQAFERSLVAVNAAWSRQDVDALANLSTPEMTRYFANDLADLRARGWTNVTRDVRLEAGDLSEAWHENGQDYATVAMRFSLIDVTTDAAGRVVEGDPTTRQTATEMWTFVRSPGAEWHLSAIQQAG
jgi:predicted lipid-binding transport protein (Tim44 family)